MWCLGCFVIYFWGVGGFGVMVGVIDCIKNCCVVFGCVVSGRCCFGQFELGNWLNVYFYFVVNGCIGSGSGLFDGQWVNDGDQNDCDDDCCLYDVC